MIYTHTIITSLERRNNDDDVVGLKTFSFVLILQI